MRVYLHCSAQNRGQRELRLLTSAFASLTTYSLWHMQSFSILTNASLIMADPFIHLSSSGAGRSHQTPCPSLHQAGVHGCALGGVRGGCSRQGHGIEEDILGSYRVLVGPVVAQLPWLILTKGPYKGRHHPTRANGVRNHGVVKEKILGRGH